MIIVTIVMMMVVVMMMIMEISCWQQARNRNVGTNLSVPIFLICDLSPDSFVVIVYVTVVAIIIPLYIDKLSIILYFVLVGSLLSYW